MKKSKLVLELRCCVGYGYMAYIEFGAKEAVSSFLKNFCMWGGSTKTFENYSMYELPEDVMKFMTTETFKGWLLKNDVEFFTENDGKYKEILSEVFSHI